MQNQRSILFSFCFLIQKQLGVFEFLGYFFSFLPIKTSCIIDDDGTNYLQMSRTKCFIKACLSK